MIRTTHHTERAARGRLGSNQLHTHADLVHDSDQEVGMNQLTVDGRTSTNQ